MRVTDSFEAADGLPVLRAGQLTTQSPHEKWLIKSLWTREAVGVVGGAPKTYKTWMGLDMAISVASNKPCLGRFVIDDPGPTLVYLAEDALPDVRARIDAISLHKEIDVSSLDVHVITAPSLRLDIEEHRQRLRATVERLRPRLLLLDPLVRMHGLDENDSGHMSRLLGFLREVQRTYHVAIILVHHASKRHRATPGHGLRGSGDIHAFADSTIYLARRDEQLRLSVEHRSATSPAPMAIHLASRSDGNATHLEILGEELLSQPAQRKPSLHDKVLQYLRTEGEPRSGSAIREAMQRNNQQVCDALKDLTRIGQVEKTKAGWRAIVDEQPRLPFQQ